jgi:hypothetical protein
MFTSNSIAPIECEYKVAEEALEVHRSSMPTTFGHRHAHACRIHGLMNLLVVRTERRELVRAVDVERPVAVAAEVRGRLSLSRGSESE